MFLDIKLGLLWSVIVVFIFDISPTPILFGLGILFALLPDIDFWVELAERGTVGGKYLGAHRTLLHHPLVYIPLAIFIASFFDWTWATLFALGVFGHFIHDSMGMGYGIRWLWPLSSRWYKLFSDHNGGIRYDFKHFLASWSDEEMRALIRERGNDNWLKEDIAYARANLPTIIGKMLLFIFGTVVLLVLLQ